MRNHFSKKHAKATAMIVHKYKICEKDFESFY